MASNLDDCASQIRDFLTREVLFSTDAFPCGDAASLLDEGIIDSMGVLELVAFVQRRFRISVGAEEVTRENFDSVGGLSAYVRRKSMQRESCHAGPAVSGE